MWALKRGIVGFLYEGTTIFGKGWMLSSGTASHMRRCFFIRNVF